MTSQVARSGVRRKIASGHKVYFMFRVYILFNIAQLAGGIFHFFFGGAGHLSILMVIYPLYYVNSVNSTTPLGSYFFYILAARGFFFFFSFSDFINTIIVTCSIYCIQVGIAM